MPRFCHYLSLIMSDLLNDSIIEGLWHVLQELLLLDCLHVGALHLQQLASLLLLSVLNNFVTLPFWSWQRGQTPVNEILFTSSDWHPISCNWCWFRNNDQRTRSEKSCSPRDSWWRQQWPSRFCRCHPRSAPDSCDPDQQQIYTRWWWVSTILAYGVTIQDWDIGSLSRTLSDGQHYLACCHMCGLIA